MTTYIVKLAVTHSVDGKTYHPGEEIDLSHLEKPVIKKLLDAGVIREKKGAKIGRTEVMSDGTDN